MPDGTTKEAIDGGRAGQERLGHRLAQERIMDLTAAALVAMVVSFVVFGTAAAWYALPRMRAVALAAAITPLLWIHAFRYVALQLFSAQAFGFAVPDGTRDQIVYGDLIGMGLALATLYALRHRWRYAIPLAWGFVVATVLDLGNAAVAGIREGLFDKAADVSWLILTFYVPALWISVVLVAWALWTRRGEPIASS
jgi:hypothetical protein